MTRVWQQQGVILEKNPSEGRSGSLKSSKTGDQGPAGAKMRMAAGDNCDGKVEVKPSPNKVGQDIPVT